MNDTVIKSIQFFAIALFALFIVYIAHLQPRLAYGSAPPGLQATIATTSQSTVGTTAIVLFATSTCAARTIETSGLGSIMLTFSDNQGAVPTGTSGFIQAASTTVTYDSGQFGCGAVKAYSFVSQLVTLTEAR